MNKSKLLMLFFIASEAFFFIALIISYVYYSRPDGNLSDTAQFLDVKKTGVFTLFLLISSLTIELAGKNLNKGKMKAMFGWLTASIVAGFVFLAGQSLEYIGLIRNHVTVSKDVFGSAFFTLTGFHGLHVFIGLVVLLIITRIISSGKYKSVEKEAFNAASVYWHFVDGVWVVVFSVVYIGAIV